MGVGLVRDRDIEDPGGQGRAMAALDGLAVEEIQDLQVPVRPARAPGCHEKGQGRQEAQDQEGDPPEVLSISQP